MNVWYAGVSSRLRKISLIASLALASAGLIPSTAVFAQKIETETVIVDYPYAFPTPPGVKTGGVFFDSIAAVGDASDRLVSASSPAAGRVEIHRMVMDGNIMRMREVAGVSITRAEPVSFQKGMPDSYHLMLMELGEPLSTGMAVPITLRFEKAGEIEIKASVVPFGSHPGQGGMNHADHGKHK